MRMTKLEVCERRVNDRFSAKLALAFKAKFSRDLTTRLDLGLLQLVSAPADDKPFTPEQKAWVEAYSDGYGEALTIVRAMANEGR